jgi:hypothetical protein
LPVVPNGSFFSILPECAEMPDGAVLTATSLTLYKASSYRRSRYCPRLTAPQNLWERYKQWPIGDDGIPCLRKALRFNAA